MKRAPKIRWLVTLAFWAAYLILGALIVRNLYRMAAGPGLRLDSYPKETLHAKVVRVDQNKKEIEVLLTIQPRETRFSLECPDVSALAAFQLGEWLTFSIANNRTEINGQKLKVSRVVFVTE